MNVLGIAAATDRGYDAPVIRVLGGPALPSSPSAPRGEGALVSEQVSEDIPLASLVMQTREPSPRAALDLGAVGAIVGPHRAFAPSREGILTYTVVSGDTLSGIAKNFEVTLETILAANESLRSNRLRPGEKILVPPVSGAFHRVELGETLGTLSALYGVPGEAILKANPMKTGSFLEAGELVIVPGAKPRRTRSSSLLLAGQLPDLRNYFRIPTGGFNWGVLHPRNAVDIANSCGTPVYAAAEGLVVAIGDPAKWNDGYGGFARIEHPNGTATRYAHMETVRVEEGEYVKQYMQIGAMGNKGNTHGETGCHLHFEVEGAKNFLAK